MKLLTGILEPSSGLVTIDGYDMETERSKAKARIGYLPENCPVYPEMTVVASSTMPPRSTALMPGGACRRCVTPRGHLRIPHDDAGPAAASGARLYRADGHCTGADAASAADGIAGSP
jgi:ABC-type sugar transport system ATPase subunit